MKKVGALLILTFVLNLIGSVIWWFDISCEQPLFGSQYLHPRDSISSKSIVEFDAMNATFAVTGPYANHSPYMYVPFFTILEFISLVGWIKVADELLNPFGDDDYDFRINYLIDRNLQSNRFKTYKLIQ